MSSYGTAERNFELKPMRQHTVIVSGGAPPGSVADETKHNYLHDDGPHDEAAWLFDREQVAKEQSKWKKIIGVGITRAPEQTRSCLTTSTPCLAWTVVGCEACVPLYIKVARFLYKILSVLPQEELCIIGGVLLVFFGGMYPMTMAAFEAFRQCGGKETYQAFFDLYEQFKIAKEASHRDDLIDDDHDGIADVEQIDGKALVGRKTRLFFAETNPVVLDRGFKGVYTAWAGVVAALKIQFAMIIALGATIGDFLGKLLSKPLIPLLENCLGEDLHKWIPHFIYYACKVIAVSIAWKIQVVISAFYSAIRGGLMISRNGLAIIQRKLAKKQWTFLANYIEVDPEKTHIDEIVGWAIAAIGFWVQLNMGFSAPFLIQLLLWPVGLLEGTLIWAINSTTDANQTPQ